MTGLKCLINNSGFPEWNWTSFLMWTRRKILMKTNTPYGRIVKKRKRNDSDFELSEDDDDDESDNDDDFTN